MMFAGCIPSHAAYFSVYEAAKEAFGANAEGHHPFAAAASGVMATVLHDAVLTPLDCVKQRLQLGLYGGFLDCVRTMVREEGGIRCVLGGGGRLARDFCLCEWLAFGGGL